MRFSTGSGRESARQRRERLVTDGGRADDDPDGGDRSDDERLDGERPDDERLDDERPDDERIDDERPDDERPDGGRLEAPGGAGPRPGEGGTARCDGEGAGGGDGEGDEGDVAVAGGDPGGTRGAADASVVGTLYRATRDLMRAGDAETVASVVVESAEEILALPVTGVHLDDGTGRLRPAAVTEAVAETFGEGPTYTADDGTVWEAYRTGEPVHVADAAERGVDTPMGSGVVTPLGDHGVLITSAREPGAFDERDFELVKLLAANAEAALDRLERERRLAALNEASRGLMVGESERAVCVAATEAARDVLGFEVNAIHVRSEDGTELVPVAATDAVRELFGDPPSLPADPGESVAGRALERGEPLAFADVRASPAVYDRDTPVRSELHFPLDDRAVLMAGSTEPDAFDDADRTLGSVFAANVEAALQRARREETLRERERQLERQAERLDEFASVVSHDLRNPLSVASGRLELAREACECDAPSEHLDAVEDAHRRMVALVDDLLELARKGRTVGETERVDAAGIARELAAERGVAATAPRPVTVDADPDRLRQLLANLVENVAVHAGPDADVRVGRLPEGGFFVADDGPGIPPERREAVLERGFTTGGSGGSTPRSESGSGSGSGSGLGLAIVRRIAEAHGWTVEVTESADGGARFEFRA
jgi:signal transduction histidine kinase